MHDLFCRTEGFPLPLVSWNHPPAAGPPAASAEVIELFTDGRNLDPLHEASASDTVVDEFKQLIRAAPKDEDEHP